MNNFIRYKLALKPENYITREYGLASPLMPKGEPDILMHNITKGSPLHIQLNNLINFLSDSARNLGINKRFGRYEDKNTYIKERLPYITFFNSGIHPENTSSHDSYRISADNNNLINSFITFMPHIFSNFMSNQMKRYVHNTKNPQNNSPVIRNLLLHDWLEEHPEVSHEQAWKDLEEHAKDSFQRYMNEGASKPLEHYLENPEEHKDIIDEHGEPVRVDNNTPYKQMLGQSIVDFGRHLRNLEQDPNYFSY